MKNSIKILIFALLTAIMITSCTGDYIDTVSADELAEKALANITTEGGTKVLDDDVILEFCDPDYPYLIDYTVIKANSAKNINEVGVFRLQDGHAEDFLPFVKSYVEGLTQSYRAMDYFPEEVEKIDCATFKTYGNYVIYSFLNEVDTEEFYNAVENLIKK